MTQPDAELVVELVLDKDAAETKFRAELSKMEAESNAAFKDMAKTMHNAFDQATVKVNKDFQDLDKTATRALKDISTAAKNTGKIVDNSLTDAARKGQSAFAELDHAATAAFKDVEYRVSGATSRISSGLTRQLRNTRTRFLSEGKGIADDFIREGERAGTGFFRSILNAAQTGIARVGSVVGDLFAGTFGAIGPFASLILVATPAIIGLVAALADLAGFLGALPALVAGLVAAFAPLIVAFQGFGTAIAAINSGDPKKIAEALKGLSPSARSVALEFSKLNVQFKLLKERTQEAFFKPLVGEFTQLANSVMPALISGFPKVASAFGGLFAAIGQALSSKDAQATLNNLFTTVARIIRELTPSAGGFFTTLFKVIDAGLPFVERFAKFMGHALDVFDQFVNKKISDGGFNKFVNDAIKTVHDLIGFMRELGRLFGTIFSSTDDKGRGLIQSLTEATRRLADFLNTKNGQETLKTLGMLIQLTGDSIIAVTIILSSAADQMFRFVHAVQDVYHWILVAGKAIGKFFTDLFHDAGKGADSVGKFIGKIGDWFAKLPGEIGRFLSKLPHQVAKFFSDAFDEALREVGRGIGLILFAVLNLPGMILHGLESLTGTLVTFFHDAWDKAYQATTDKISSLISFVMSVPGMIVTALVALPGLLAGVFVAAFNFVRKAVSDGIDSVVSFVKSVPDRLAALKDFFLSAGSKLIHGFLDGFKATGSFLSDLAGTIVDGVKAGLNHVIDKINEGIKQVDDVWPGPKLPLLPRLAKGGLALGPAIIGEQQQELAVPLDDPRAQEAIRRAIGDTSGNNVTFAPGSIVVNFNGVTPTPQQAYETGQAVGAGIAASLTGRNIRTQVRTA